MADIKTGFLVSLFSGAYGGAESKVDQRTGVIKTIVTFMTSNGKKYRFVVSGEAPDFSQVSMFSVITVEISDLIIGKSGEYGNYGDQNFTVSGMKLSQPPVVSAVPSVGKPVDIHGPLQPDKKAA